MRLYSYLIYFTLYQNLHYNNKLSNYTFTYNELSNYISFFDNEI